MALQLAGLDPALADQYQFRAEEIKQTALRLDGLLTPWAEQQLSQASTDQLEAWTLRILDADSLEAILRGCDRP